MRLAMHNPAATPADAISAVRGMLPRCTSRRTGSCKGSGTGSVAHRPLAIAGLAIGSLAEREGSQQRIAKAIPSFANTGSEPWPATPHSRREDAKR